MTVSILAARLTESVYNVIVMLERDAARQNKSVLKTTLELNIPLAMRYQIHPPIISTTHPPVQETPSKH